MAAATVARDDTSLYVRIGPIVGPFVRAELAERSEPGSLLSTFLKHPGIVNCYPHQLFSDLSNIEQILT
jgi:hypothetical protein